MKPSIQLALVILTVLLATSAAHAYPLDGYAETGIRRVEGARLAQEGQVKDIRQPPGALLTTAQVDLRLLDHPDLVLPAPDPQFTAELVKLLAAIP